MKHKLSLIGFSYLAGLICAVFFDTFTLGIFLCSASFMLGALTLNRFGKSSAAAAFFVASAAMGVYGIYTLTVYLPAAELDGTTKEISGTITEVRYYKNDTAAYTIKTDVDGTVVYISLFAEDNGGRIGDNIRLDAKLSLMKDNTLFSEKSYYRSKGIFLSASPRSEAKIVLFDGFSLKRIISDYGDHIGNRVSVLLTGDEGSLLKAAFSGDKSELSDTLSENIKRAGVSHFTAVSGLHLTVISHIVLLIISLTSLKYYRHFKFGVLAVIILLFMLFFKLSSSVTRAGIMLIMYYGEELFMRKGSTLNSLGAAVLIITLFEPYACTDPGLLMSLAGTFGVGVLSPFIMRELRRKRLAPVVASLSAIFCTLPLSCVYFGGFSTVGILTNLLIFPLFLPAMVCAFLFALSGGNGSGLMFVSGLCAKGMICVIDFLGGLKYSYFPVNNGFAAPIIILSSLFTVLSYLYFRNTRLVLKAVTLSVCVLLFLTAVSRVYYADKAKITMYSDGRDACIIAEHKGSVFIAVSDDSQKLLNSINDYLKDNFIDKVSAVAVLNSSHNNLAGFKTLDSCVFLPPNSATEAYSDKISLKCEKDRCTVTVKDIGISLSPAKAAEYNDISVLYGYSGTVHPLEGMIFVSDKRLYNNTENNDYISLYYEAASYILTDNRTMQKTN